MLGTIKKWFDTSTSEAEFQQHLADIRQKAPVPVFWLFGKTQSGKTSIIKFLTGAEDAEIGQGFQACTRFSRLYQFPTPQAPLITFLDTRGLEEPSYDPSEDLARFDREAHVVVVTVKVLDQALERIVGQVRLLNKRQPHRPIILALTCLHEAYPQRQHPIPEEFFRRPGWENDEELALQYPDLFQSLAKQRERFAPWVKEFVPIDFTPPEEGFEIPQYGGEHLREKLLNSLPHAYRQTLIQLDEMTGQLQDLFGRRALPHILGFSSLAATAGAFPIPWVDMLVLPGIQTRMIYHLARVYGQPLVGQRFLELAGTLGMGMLVRQATREMIKFIPWVGSVAGAALAGSATFALGKAFCFYYQSIHKGHVPQAEELKRHYQDELTRAESLWRRGKQPA